MKPSLDVKDAKLQFLLDNKKDLSDFYHTQLKGRFGQNKEECFRLIHVGL